MPVLLLLLGCSDHGVKVYNSAPEVTITSPPEGASLLAGADLVVTGTVHDLESENDELTLSWVLDSGTSLTGDIAWSGDDLTWTTAALDAGDHTLTLTALDPSADAGSDALSFTVAAAAAPVVTFQAPEDGAVVVAGSVVRVDAYVADADEVDLSALTLTWGGSAAGAGDGPLHPDSTGLAEFYLPAQAVGEWTLSLTAADPGGHTGQGSLAFIAVEGDTDGDGHVAVGLGGDDCDDTDANVHPDAPETCDGLDDDCDGEIDEPGSSGESTWYADADGDGFGDAGVPTYACTRPAGATDDATDCDDTDETVFPGATEYCNGHDDDCDGEVDEPDASDATAWYDDADGDGYGDPAAPTYACAAPVGTVDNPDDCDDGDPTVSPDAAEICNGIDDDCDGLIDDADPVVSGVTTTYADADGDGYGAGAGVLACDAPPGNVANATDCDDAAPDRHPGADELCDGVDDDCDGLIDDADPSVIGSAAWYADTDGDGYGAEPAILGCVAPLGYVADATDCNDGAATIHPGGTEVCDAANADEDCDGLADDADPSASGKTTYYVDADGDGYGAGAGTTYCDAPAGRVTNASDCDDTDASHTLVCDPVVAWLDDADAKLYGEVAYDYAARGVAAAGDVNGDGYGDVLVGSPGDDVGGSGAGAVYIVEGPFSGTRSLSTAEVKLVGEAGGDSLCTVAGIGDVNADGFDDVALGAVYGNSLSGSAYIVHGGLSGTLDLSAADLILTGTHTSDYTGVAMAPAGDQTGDGHPDLLLGAHGDDSMGTGSGAAYVISGTLTGRRTLASSYSAKLVGPSGLINAAIGLDGGEDVDGDGVADLLIGTASGTSTSDGGRAYLVLGPVSGTVDLGSADSTLYGERYLDYAGRLVAMLGDTDSDGYGDLLLGAYANDALATDAGAAYLERWPLSATEYLSAADAKLEGVNAGDGVGFSVAGPGDVDGDGDADVLVSGNGYDGGATDGGAAWLFYSPLTGTHPMTDADVTLLGSTAGGYSGAKVSGAGDVNGDGLDDLLVGAENDATMGPQTGAAWLWLGG